MYYRIGYIMQLRTTLKQIRKNYIIPRKIEVLTNYFDSVPQNVNRDFRKSGSQLVITNF